MAHVLVVKEAYGDLRRGDIITDPDEVAKLHSEIGHHFVKREAHSHELPQVDEATAKKAAKAKTEPKEAA